jgi:hypothetical protein
MRIDTRQESTIVDVHLENVYVPSMPNRIPASDLRQLRRVLFGTVLSPRSLATYVHMTYNTLWVNLHRNGITPAIARRLAVRLFEWSSTLRNTAYELEALAHQYDPPKRKK